METTTGELIAFGALLIGIIGAIIAIFRLRWSMRQMQQNHFETFKTDFWKQFNLFKDSCSKHRQETAEEFGALRADVTNLQEGMKRIEGKVNSRKL